MPKPRLLMLVQRFPPDIGGMATSGARIAAACRRLGHAVEVVAWTKSLPPGEVERLDAGEVAAAARGVALHRVGLFHNWDLSLQHTGNVMEWLHGQAPFDALWGHGLYPAGFMAAFFGSRFGVRSIVSARGNDVDQMMFPPGDFARLLWTLQRASAITSVSADLARKIDVLLGRDGGVVVTPNAVDTGLFSPGPPDAELRRRLGIAEGEAVLAFSGELRHKKGFPFMQEALTAVRRARPACLLVVGEVRPREQAQLAHYAAQFPEDAARVLVTGHLDDPAAVARHLRLADLFLMPSLWDGLPNALLEALSCGVLCLGSDGGGIPEVLEHGLNGVVLPRTQLHRLGEAILEALALPEARRRGLAEAGRKTIVERFDGASEAQALRRVLGKGRQRSEAWDVRGNQRDS
ncbi:MAG: glycosyltransferase [Planctomycetota bacterium]|nr:glycosyltransferase [Planctomycetota bacterium]